MKAEIVDSEKFKIKTGNLLNIFNKVEFSELNKCNAERVLYIIIYKDESPRFAVTLGIRDNRALSPFSAPFGYMESIKKGQSVKNYYEAITALEQCLSDNNIEEISFFMPPSFYDKYTIECLYNTLLNSNWEITCVDLSFAINLEKMVGKYEDKVSSNTRRNLKIANSSNLCIKACIDDNEIEKAYEVIYLNHDAKGYPLRMTMERVKDTLKIVPHYVYAVYIGEIMIASAFIYRVTNDIVQVIYWGDRPGYENTKVMNYLCQELIRIFNKIGFKYIDIGISTELGKPNYGLCDFKDSIGCERTAKFQISKRLQSDA